MIPIKLRVVIIMDHSDLTLSDFMENSIGLKRVQMFVSAVTCCHFDEDRIISGSFDSTVRIWKISPFKCQGVLTGHTAEVVSWKYAGK